MTTPDYGPSPAQIARMRAKIADGIAARQQRDRTRRRVTVGVSIVAAASLVTGGVVLATLPKAEHFSCYTADALDSTVHVIGYPVDVEPPTAVSEQVEWALGLCEIARDLGDIPQPAKPVVCRLPDQLLGVFPNTRGLTADALCTALGLPEPEDPVPGYEPPLGQPISG
jgi:hypothetical protein